jgi:hypothetical protein
MLKYFLTVTSTSLILGSLSLAIGHHPTIARPSQITQSYQISQGFSWGDIMRLLAPPRRQGGTRDASVCLLSMSQDASAITPTIRANPVLIWDKPANTVSLRRFGETKTLWKTKLTSRPGVQKIRYNGKPLAPGEYEWVVNNGLTETGAHFQVWNAADRQAIADKLAPLTDKSEATVQARIKIYQDAGLRSEAIEELHSLSRTNAAIKQELEALSTHTCPKPAEPDSTTPKVIPSSS